MIGINGIKSYLGGAQGFIDHYEALHARYQILVQRITPKVISAERKESRPRYPA